MKQLTLITSLLLANLVSAREWTSTDGRKIEADLLSVEDDVAVLEMKGQEYRVPLARLSKEDNDFIATEMEKKREEEAAANAERLAESKKLFGVELKPGETVVVETDLTPETSKAFNTHKMKPLTMRIGIRLPENFDPAKPQKVFWPSGGLNNEDEWRSGNLGAMSLYDGTAAAEGWIVIAVDSTYGNPRELDPDMGDGCLPFFHEAVAKLSEKWPDFKSWQHATGGFSGGAKVSFYRTAQLVTADVNVVGMFLGGCNQDNTEAAENETKVKSNQLKDVKVWQSWGDSDELVDESQVANVSAALEGAGYDEIKVERYEGGHSLNLEEFKKALAWFVQ